MAIIKCFNCQKSVSDKQSNCPYCGYELNITVESESDIRNPENVEKINSGDVSASISKPFDTTEDSSVVSDEFQGIFKPLRTNNVSSSEDENESLSGIFKSQDTVEEFPKEDKNIKIQVKTESKNENPIQCYSGSKSRKWKILVISVASLILVSVAALLIVSKVIIPKRSKGYEEKYNQALSLMDEGEYLEAVSLFEDMDGYKDSNIKISVCQTLISYGEVKMPDENKDVVDDQNIETRTPELTDGEETIEETNESNFDDGNSESGIYNGEEIFSMIHDSTGADVIDVEKRMEAMDDDNQKRQGFIVYADKNNIETFLKQDKSSETEHDEDMNMMLYAPETDNCNSVVYYFMHNYIEEGFGDVETCSFYIYDDQASAQNAFDFIISQYEHTNIDFAKSNDSEYMNKDGLGYFVLNLDYKNYLEPGYKQSMGNDFYLVEYYIKPNYENFKSTFASYLVDNMIIIWSCSTVDPNFVPKTYECIMNFGFEAPFKTENSQEVLNVQIERLVDSFKKSIS